MCRHAVRSVPHAAVHRNEAHSTCVHGDRSQPVTAGPQHAAGAACSPNFRCLIVGAARHRPSIPHTHACRAWPPRPIQDRKQGSRKGCSILRVVAWNWATASTRAACGGVRCMLCHVRYISSGVMMGLVTPVTASSTLAEQDGQPTSIALSRAGMLPLHATRGCKRRRGDRTLCQARCQLGCCKLLLLVTLHCSGGPRTHTSWHSGPVPSKPASPKGRDPCIRARAGAWALHGTPGTHAARHKQPATPLPRRLVLLVKCEYGKE